MVLPSSDSNFLLYKHQRNQTQQRDHRSDLEKGRRRDEAGLPFLHGGDAVLVNYPS
jgi:hypothetical protein